MKALLCIAVLVVFGYLMSRAIIGLGDQDPNALHTTDIHMVPVVR